MTKIDLHIHSRHSDDADFPPEQLVAMAKEIGLSVMAITDHNRTGAVAAALTEGKRLGVEVVPAVEVDGVFQGVGLHILGYGVDHSDPRFAELRNDVDEKLRNIGMQRLNIIRKLGIAIDDEQIQAKTRDGIIPGELIAEVSLADPRNDGNPLLAPYRPGGSRDKNPNVNFHWDFCSAGRPAYVHIEFMPLASAINLIVDTGGVPVLAHPGASLRGIEHLIDDLAKAGIKGIEAYCSYHNPEQAAFWTGEAKRLGLFATCGSDFHGKNKPAVKMGRHGCDFEDAVLRDLREAMRN